MEPSDGKNRSQIRGVLRTRERRVVEIGIGPSHEWDRPWAMAGADLGYRVPSLGVSPGSCERYAVRSGEEDPIPRTIFVALVVTPEALPPACGMFPGRMVDQSVLRGLTDRRQSPADLAHRFAAALLQRPGRIPHSRILVMISPTLRREVGFPSRLGVGILGSTNVSEPSASVRGETRI